MKATSAAWREQQAAKVKAIEPRSRVGDSLFHVAAPARATDQTSPLPGTRWEEAADGGCDLVLADQAAYARFLFSGGAGHRRWCP